MDPGYPFLTFTGYQFGPVPDGFNIQQAIHDPKWERVK